MRANWPWLGVVNIWYFRQVGDITDSKGDYYFRMVDVEFTTQPVYRELVKSTDLQRLAVPGSYGPLSPSLVSKGRWSTIRATNNAPPVIRSERPGDTVTIRFQGNELTLDGEFGPKGGRLGVLIDGSTDAVRALPQDDKGRRYIDFRATDTETAPVTVVSGLDPLGAVREHEVTLTTLPNGDGTNGTVVLSGVDVAYTRSSSVFLIVSVLAALLALAATVRALGAVGRLRRARRVA
jgi:hypothetical protein